MRTKLAWLLPLFVLTACGGGSNTAATAAATKAKADSVTKDSVTAAAAKAVAHAPKNRHAGFDTAAAAGKRPLSRETYHYEGAPRDPFRAVLLVQDRGPELPDLRLVAILYDDRDTDGSIVTFRENGSDRRYVWHSGERAGRITVVSVDRTDVTLREDDFGVEHRQTYSLRKPENEKP